MSKQNCWEVKKCGRQPGGEKVDELGICPASVSGEGDGINDGENRGRICWAVVGTYCGGKVQGTFAEKGQGCMECEFFAQVSEDEGEAYEFLLPGQEVPK